MKFLSALLMLILSCLLLAQEPADSLPRRGFFGVNLQPAEGGARVAAIFDGSTAAAFGIVPGDIIATVDGQPVPSPEAVVAALGRHVGGDRVRIGLLRREDRLNLEVTLKPYPEESMTNATVRYGVVQTATGVRLRSILSIPNQKPGPYPAVLLIQGGGCGSVESPFAPTIAQPGLMHVIGSQGFVTLRVEKSGVGDSSGPPCDTIGFQEELAGYQAAVKTLRSVSEVDSRRIYLIGISLGGVFAPLLAAGENLAGISVYGTLDGPPSPYPGRSVRFFEEFSGIDVKKAWTMVGTRVQVLHGEYDAGTTPSAHETITRIVNESGKGSAEFRELPGLDHCWTRHSSLEASKDKCGQGEMTSALSDAILDFLKRNP